jgi:hypothetical protein
MMRLAAAGALGASASGWMGVLARQAAAQDPDAVAAGARRPKACILLWMDGGPGHLDTFDPKPEARGDVRGELKAIGTSVPGIQVGERFPKLAKLMDHAAILRGMCTDEADHARARVYMHTGQKPGVGGVNYPTVGSLVSSELPRGDSPLPNFVVMGSPLFEFIPSGSGYLGPRHQPMVLTDPAKGLENLKPVIEPNDFADRMGVLEQLEQGFGRSHKVGPALAHRTTLERAVQLVRSDQGKAFDIALEPAAVREGYGDSELGRGCLLARRLVEAGVAFVEVYSSNWDYHEKNVFDAAKGMMSQLDQGVSALIGDLKSRGLLQDTLIFLMGEFGRSPMMNRTGGRDHFSKAWSTVLIGGGIKGGQVVGKTDHEGARVVERPISVLDFMATVCRALSIDYAKKHVVNDRPVRLVEAGAKVVEELFS